MASRVFLVANHHRKGNILTVRMIKWWKTILFILIQLYQKTFYLVKKFNHWKLRYTDPSNVVTKRTLVSQTSTLEVAEDSNISHNLNLSINSPTIILPII